MAGFFHVSDAASLALHALALLAKDKDQTSSAKVLAQTMGVSLTHLAKVMQRLEHAGYVQSKRGPAGGFVLKKKAAVISLREIYETIAGSIKTTRCPLGIPQCKAECPLRRTLYRAEADIVRELARTTLADFAGTLKIKS